MVCNVKVLSRIISTLAWMMMVHVSAVIVIPIASIGRILVLLKVTTSWVIIEACSVRMFETRIVCNSTWVVLIAFAELKSFTKGIWVVIITILHSLLIFFVEVQIVCITSLPLSTITFVSTVPMVVPSESISTTSVVIYSSVVVSVSLMIPRIVSTIIIVVTLLITTSSSIVEPDILSKPISYILVV